MENENCATNGVNAENLQHPEGNYLDSPDQYFRRNTSPLETIVEVSPYLQTPLPSAQSSQIASCNSSAVQSGSDRRESKRSSRKTRGWRRADPQAESERELAMTNVWYRSAMAKKIPAPAQHYPVYLKNPPVLYFSETECSSKRKMMAQSRMKSMPELVTRRVDRVYESVQPKMNKATSLRNSFIRNQPVMSTYSESHFYRFQKPPFKSGIRCGI